MERAMPPIDGSVSEAELSALADGSIADPDRRAELQRRIDASPELRALYERERRVGLALRAVYFPNWASNFGWKDVGQRIDSFYGRAAVTVYYRRGGETIAYTILDAPGLRQPPAPGTGVGGVEYRTLRVGGRMVVTWRREGQTCVLSGAGVGAPVLRTLAAWDSRALRETSEGASALNWGASS